MKKNIKKLFKKCAENSIRRKIATFLAKKAGLVHSHTTTKKWMEVNSIPEENYCVVEPAEKIFLKKPKTVDEKLWEIFNLEVLDDNKEVFVAKIPDASYVSKFSSYITRDNFLLNDLSLEFGAPRDKDGFEHSVFYSDIPDETYYDKTVAIIDTAGAYNYFHWIINILPKIDFIKKSKIEVDYYLISTDKPYQLGSLKFFDIPEEKIIQNTQNLNIKAKFLVASSLPSTPAIVNTESLRVLREKFNVPKKLEKRVFITRRNAAQGRRIINEDEVIQMIREYGFEVYELESMDFRSQVELFSSAEIVVSPHGAGLTNMLFCPVEAKIVEIFNPKYRALCYWVLSNLLGLDYYYLIGEGERPSLEQVTYNCFGNITVDVEKLERTLNLAGISKVLSKL